MTEKKTRRKHIRYAEGQWFAVPLKDGGYALGIIVRGSSKTRGGLGYFFGPRYPDVPDEDETWRKQPADAVLVAWFLDDGISWGQWPLIPSTRPFRREEWPVPAFWRFEPGNLGKGWVVAYRQDDDGSKIPEQQTYVDAKRAGRLPDDRVDSFAGIESRLETIFSDQERSLKKARRKPDAGAEG
jgi:hypothetical protein